MARASFGVVVRLYSAVVLLNFFLTILRILHWADAKWDCVRIRVRGLGLRSGLRLALGSGLYFYFV